MISKEDLRRVVTKKRQEVGAASAAKSAEKDKAPAAKGKEKRVLRDRSPPPRPTRPRLSSSEKARNDRDGAEAPVGETLSEGPHVPSQSTQEKSSVAIPEVPMDMLEKSCLVCDLHHLSV